MFRQRSVLERMFAMTGITINSNSPWDLHVRDDRIFSRLLQNKSLGLGETYMEGWWECRQLDIRACKENNRYICKSPEPQNVELFTGSGNWFEEMENEEICQGNKNRTKFNDCFCQ